MERKTESSEWPVGRSAEHSTPQVKQTWLNRAIQASVLDMALNVGYLDGMVLDQFICKATEDGWLAMIKAHKHGKRRVAFVAGFTFGGAVELAASFAERGCLTWQPDKWPPKTIQRRGDSK